MTKIDKENSIDKILRKRYILALSIIAFLVLFSQLTIQYTLKKQENDSRVVNIAGRQRMLSQRISKDILAIYISESSTEQRNYLNELKISTSLWSISHEGLINGDVKLGLPGKNSPVILKLFSDLEPNYRKILEASNSIIAMAENKILNKNDVYAELSVVKENEPIFLKGMDTIVFQYDDEARTKVTFIKHLEYTLMFVTFLVLILEIKYIFRPAEKQIKTTLASLNNHATIDGMTGLINRRTGLLILEKELEKAKRLSANLTICFIDLDGLKFVNDNYGHFEGDWFIKSISNTLQDSIRSGDTAFRLGGDEFIIILTNCNLDEATIVLKRINDSIAAINTNSNKPFKIGFSYGFAEHKIFQAKTVDEFIHYADEQMYEDKKMKKNSI